MPSMALGGCPYRITSVHTRLKSHTQSSRGHWHSSGNFPSSHLPPSASNLLTDVCLGFLGSAPSQISGLLSPPSIFLHYLPFFLLCFLPCPAFSPSPSFSFFPSPSLSLLVLFLPLHVLPSCDFILHPKTLSSPNSLTPKFFAQSPG